MNHPLPAATSFFLTILAMAVFAQPAGATDPGSATTLRMTPAMQFDPVLNQNAYSILIPTGWKFQGEIVWVNGSPNPWPHLSVSNPAQHAAWRRFPRFFYIAGLANPNYPEGSVLPSGFEVRPLPASTMYYVKSLLIPKMIAEVANATDVRLISQADMPDVDQMITDHDPLHRKATTQRFRIGYTAPDGPVEREFVTTILASPPKGGSVTWMADTTTVRAPAGRLDKLLPTFATISSSVKVQLPWFNTLAQVQQAFLTHQEEIEAQALRNQADAINQRMAIMRQYAQQSSQMVSDEIHQRFAQQMQAKDQEQTREMHYINNTGGYKDPSDGSTITLSAEYKYHYVDNEGDVVETNDPTYSPVGGPGTNWQQMDRVN
jgi:hypothetical protein